MLLSVHERTIYSVTGNTTRAALPLNWNAIHSPFLPPTNETNTHTSTCTYTLGTFVRGITENVGNNVNTLFSPHEFSMKTHLNTAEWNTFPKSNSSVHQFTIGDSSHPGNWHWYNTNWPSLPLVFCSRRSRDRPPLVACLSIRHWLTDDEHFKFLPIQLLYSFLMCLSEKHATRHVGLLSVELVNIFWFIQSSVGSTTTI